MWTNYHPIFPYTWNLKKLKPITDPSFKTCFKNIYKLIWKHLKHILYFSRVVHAVIKVICRWKVIFKELKSTRNLQREKEKADGGGSSSIFSLMLVTIIFLSLNVKKKARKGTHVVNMHWAGAMAPRYWQHIAKDSLRTVEGNYHANPEKSRWPWEFL